MHESSQSAWFRSLQPAQVWALVAVGCFMTASAAWLLTLWTLRTRPSLLQTAVQAGVFVLLTAGEGALASWMVSRLFGRDFQFGRVALHAGVLWVLIAPIMIYLRYDSPWAVLFMSATAVAAAYSLREVVPAGAVSAASSSAPEISFVPPVQFAELPTSRTGLGTAFTVAVCLEGAVVAMANQRLFATSLLLSAGIFVLAWRMQSSIAVRRRASVSPRLRLATAFVFAIALTVIALNSIMLGESDGISRWGFAGHRSKGIDPSKSQTVQASANTGSGYKGIILWMPPRRKDKILPPPPNVLRIANANARPINIPFDGAYWYFQPPYDSPGRDPHVAHGDPIGVSIRSSNRLPLLMEAHQKLVSPVELNCCRAMRINVRNGDNVPGTILLGVVLYDSKSAGNPSLPLTAQPVVSTQAGHFAVKPSPVDETLEYAIPANSDISRFDQITVVYFPAGERSVDGAKISIQNFELLRR